MSNLPVNSNQYSSGAASLFSAMARETPRLQDGEGSVEIIVISCPRCLSDDLEMVDHHHQIYTCRKCRASFERPAPG